MNFEKIELIGFKSFADKMEITFDNGVTAIVGPNGCGKSNIADAVRWVLGEQSAKTLRGSSMTDVIFNGTQNRKSLSYCEVSLYFDNSNHLFKSVDYQEVILTRKLFRSGESEYYVNKQLARLRDIVDLLHECGVSKNGYSIIGQGKVSEILSSKPEDRRAIFEEAVGISNSKSTKLESDRKLERTRDSIVRVTDIMTELQKQLEPAERASEKTRKFLEFSEQLRYHEINNFLYKHENASSVKNKISLRIDGLVEEIKINENELIKAEADYEKHRNELQESDDKITKLHEEILKRSLNQEHLQGQTKVYQERIGFFKSEIERLSADESERREKIELLNKAITAKKEYLDKCITEKAKLISDNSTIDEKLSALYEKIAHGENLSKTSQSEILEAAEKLAGINKNIGSLDTEKSVLSERLSELDQNIEKLSSELSSLNADYEKDSAVFKKDSENRDRLEGLISETEKTVSEANQKLSTLTNDIYKLNIEINNLGARQRIYQNMKESFEGYPASVRRLMTDAKTNATLKSHIKAVVAQIIKTDKKYEVAIETAIGNAVQNIVTETPEDAQFIIEYLKRIEGGRVTVLPVTSVKPHPNSPELISALKMSGVLGAATKLVKYDIYFTRIIEYLLGNTLIVDSSANALAIAKTFKFAFKIVTLDGDVFNPTGTISGGSRRANTASLISTDRMIEQLNSEAEEKRATLEKLIAEKDKFTRQSNEGVEKLNSYEPEYDKCKQSVSALTVKINSLKTLIEEKEKELAANEQARKTVFTRLTEIDKKFVDINEGNKLVTEKKQSASFENEKLRAEYEKLCAERDSLIEQNVNNKNRLSFLEAEINAATTDITRMKNDVVESEQIAQKDLENVESDKGIIEGFYKEIEKLTISEEESSGIKELRENLEKVEEFKQKLNSSIAQDDLKRQFHSSEITKLTEKRHEEELAIAKVDSELEYMEQRVSEEYGLGYEDCVKLRDEEYNIAGSNQEIERLKRRIAMLGNINANAIE
ncbi:MAG: chromosome segregation protein SMC, partial [Clostridia bacterium]|nr:chromosome segregation protein SMC [Clostridia bacterium]